MIGWFVRLGDHVWVAVEGKSESEALARAGDESCWLEVIATTKRLSDADRELVARFAGESS